MALRYGRADARFTQDLDAARIHPLTRFIDDFEAGLGHGWGGFTGRVVDRKPPRPQGIPVAYVMQPFDVKLEYLGRPWRTVKFELGHNEIDDAVEPVSEPGSDRVRDLVDLQLLDKREELDLGQLRATCLRLFDYRQLHSWPPSVEVGVGWDELYEAAIEGVDVLLEVGDAVAWANGLITRIAEA